MKIITYNVRGLGGGEKRAEVLRLVLEKNPLVLCLQETKLELMNEQLVKSLWGDGVHNLSYQPSIGASGGLVTVWDMSRIEVTSSVSFRHVLVIKGKVLLTGEDFVILNVYAPCDSEATKILWGNLLLHIQNNIDVCICVFGDFNSMRSVDERKGRAMALKHTDAEVFNTFIHDILLIDLRICGRSFTWYRGDGVSMSRLDRFLLSNKWCDTWPHCIQVAYQRGLSDHVSVMLHVDEMSVLDAKAEIVDLQETEATELRDLSVSLHSTARLQNIIHWKKSRMNWLKEGDANSKKFHNYMSQRRRHNNIHLVSADGGNVDGVHAIRAAVFIHFSNHFQSRDVVTPGVEGLNFRKLSFIEARTLTKPFCIEEVKQVVWDCDSYKSPGPDGVSFGFVKEFWSLLKDDLLQFMVEFHRNGKLSKGLNSTFIALIPKVNSPQRLNDFRPISLVGSLHKILAKVLANRLRSVIGSVVSESQSAFVKGKQILDGILIANEAVDEATRLKKELLLFKVDFEKAYDLDSVMANMNFPRLCWKWILECVGTAKASVLMNGSPTDNFRFF